MAKEKQVKYQEAVERNLSNPEKVVVRIKGVMFNLLLHEKKLSANDEERVLTHVKIKTGIRSSDDSHNKDLTKQIRGVYNEYLEEL